MNYKSIAIDRNAGFFFQAAVMAQILSWVLLKSAVGINQERMLNTQ